MVGWIEKIYEKNMDGWMDKKKWMDIKKMKKRWMVGWIKNKKIDGWLDGYGKYMKKIYGWIKK